MRLLKSERPFFLLVTLLWMTSRAVAETSLSSPTISTALSVGRIVAIVNNEPIFANDLERESEPFIERFKKSYPEKNQIAEKVSQLKKEILDRIIEEKLLIQEGKNKKIRVTKLEIEEGIKEFKEPFKVDEQGNPRQPSQIEKAFRDQIIKEGMTQDQFNKRVEEQIIKLKLIEQEVKSKVEMAGEEEIKKFFDKIRKKIAGKSVETSSEEEEVELTQISKYLGRMTGAQVRIRHIMIRSLRDEPIANRSEAKKKIETVLQKLKNGEDFAFLAKKFSEDPLGRERGGDLGFVAEGDIGLPEIDKVLFKMKEGEISPIVETDIGVHLVKVIEKKAPHPLEYEDVKEDLKKFIAQRSFNQKLEKYFKDLRTKANIKINPI